MSQPRSKPVRGAIQGLVMPVLFFLAVSCPVASAQQEAHEPANVPAPEEGASGLLSRLSFGFEYSAYDWVVREYDNVWLLSRNHPHENLEDIYLNRDAHTDSIFLTCGIRLTDVVEVVGKVGAMRGGEEETNEDPGEYDQEPAWGLGINAAIWESDGGVIRFDGGFRYERGASSDWIRKGTPYEGDIETWALDLTSAWTLNRSPLGLSVLAGLSYCDLQLPYRHPSELGLPDREGGFESEDRFGGVIGLRLTVKSAASLVFLQRFGPADGTSIAASFSL